MASFDYNFQGLYAEFEGQLEKVENDPATGTLSDGDPGQVFEEGEELANDGPYLPATSEFYGVYVDGDVTIVLTFDGTLYSAWADVDDPDTHSFPNHISFSSISHADFPACFLAGTRIATPTGRVAVEDLRIGDSVLTVEGGPATVRWIGRQSVTTAFGAPEAHWPVLIRAGALGEGRPAADLRLTSDHALLVDGALIQAGALLNGAGVRRLTKAELGDRYTVYHVETGRHDLVIAEGVAAETFVDNVSRRRFDNFAEYAALYGETSVGIAEMDRPRVKSARQLPRSTRVGLEKASRALAGAMPDVA